MMKRRRGNFFRTLWKHMLHFFFVGKCTCMHTPFLPQNRRAYYNKVCLYSLFFQMTTSKFFDVAVSRNLCGGHRTRPTLSLTETAGVLLLSLRFPHLCGPSVVSRRSWHASSDDVCCLLVSRRRFHAADDLLRSPVPSLSRRGVSVPGSPHARTVQVKPS